MLKDTLCEQGEWAFRWRSVVPSILLFPALIVAIIDIRYLFGSHDYDQAWDLFSMLFVVTGLSIRIWTTGHTPRRTSGRNTKGQVADELNTTGIYSLVRNPLYLGNFIGGFGVVLMVHSWWLTLYYIFAFSLYFERVIMAEERFLIKKFGKEYDDWASRIPAVVPRVKGYVEPRLPFCWKTVIRREYITVSMVVFIVFLFEVGEDFVNRGGLILDDHWLAVAAVNGAAFLFLRMVSKWTGWLKVFGR